MNKIKITVSIILIAILCVSAAGCGGGSTGAADSANGADAGDSQAQTASGVSRMLSAACVVAPDTVGGQGLGKFAELVNEMGKGEIGVDAYYNGTLGTNAEMMEQLIMGTLDFAHVSAANLSVYSDACLIFDVPFEWVTAEAAVEGFTGELGDRVLNEITEEVDGLVAIGWTTQGFRHITAGKEIRSPKDLAGMKIRMMDNKLHTECFAAMGASPTTMAYSEVYTGLQQGTIDMQENPLSNIYTARFHEVNKYTMLDGHVYDPVIILCSRATYDSLTPEQQTMLWDAAHMTGEWIHEQVVDIDQEYIGKITADGAFVIDMSVEEKLAFQEMCRPVYDSWAARIGKDKMDMVNAINAKYLN
ncbi:MAG: TRAP transporter substrate-binding protein [Clostridiales Family XIII bacterium]|jgi:tripartite ATP-independent transporter DctP family solute receptor|nr:TRAP transporter substrate-binding protein [Clostridiales Family XIII bacterium]